MPRGELYINGYDAYVTWGISMDTTSLSALLTPVPLKDWTTNEVRTENGTRYLRSALPKKDKRELTLTIQMSATSQSAFFRQYEAFCAVLESGVVEIRTKYQPKIYKCLFSKITQFTQFRREYATLGLSLVEPDPSDRPTYTEGDDTTATVIDTADTIVIGNETSDRYYALGEQTEINVQLERATQHETTIDFVSGSEATMLNISGAYRYIGELTVNANTAYVLTCRNGIFILSKVYEGGV